jgi:predicted CXXCH cytochrome family protein
MIGQSSVAQEESTGPHWKEDACQTCHEDAAPVSSNIHLKMADGDLCESCHGSRGDALPCRHISNVSPGDLALPHYYQDSTKDGQIVCTTCHDLAFQCANPSIPYSFMNPGFLRDRVSRDSGKQCLECHGVTGLDNLNPHNGTTGTPPRMTCLLCHESLPQADEAGNIDTEFNMRHDLNDACSGCHKVRPHPGNAFSGKPVGWEHLVVPSEGVVENMRKTEEGTGIRLPLGRYKGEVNCATCHNPHGFRATPSADDAKEMPKYRLRANNICQACHDK